MTKLYKDILELLAEDARYTFSQIGAMLGASENDVKAAIKSMTDDGIIVKYRAVVNQEKLPDNYVEALIEVKVTPQKSRGFDAIAEEIYRFAEVRSLYLMSGGFDLAVFVEGKSLREVAMFVSEKLSMLDTVISTSTHFILKKYKVDGVLLCDNSEIKREIII